MDQLLLAKTQVTQMREYHRKFDELYAQVDDIKRNGTREQLLAKYAEIDRLSEEEAANLGITL